MTRPIIFAWAFAIVCGGSQLLCATEPEAVSWNDLAPEKAFEDPFDNLNQQQLQDLGYLVRVRQLIAADKLEPDGADANDAAGIQERLQESGIDVPYLLSLRDQVRRIRERQAHAVQPELDGKVVQISGYVVALRTSGHLVSEFLLVPTVDACSHAALPPPNQIIHVEWRKGFADRGRATAVRVTGQIVARETARTLQRASGPAEIKSAYVIIPQEIEEYSSGQK